MLTTNIQVQSFLDLKPLEIRESVPTRATKVDTISFVSSSSIKLSDSLFQVANAIEMGRAVARDIGGSDPERMSAPNVAEYITQLFKGSPIKVEIISDAKKIEKDFPCLGNLILLKFYKYDQK